MPTTVSSARDRSCALLLLRPAPLRPSGTLERVRRRHQILTLALSSALLLVGCGGSGSESEQGDGRKAAEPAGASELSAPPAGTVKQVAPQPQGIVYDAASDSLVVAVRDPDRVLVLDPTTLQQRLSVDLPGKVRHLQTSAQGGTVLVPVETANKIFEVDLADGGLRATDVQRHPHDAASAPNGDVLVGNEFSGSLSVVRRGRVTHTFTDLRQPGGVVAEGDTAVVVDVRDYSVTTYDIEAEKRISRLPAGEGPTHVVVADLNKIAVTDTRGDEVLLYTIDPLEKIGAIRLPDSPYGLTADPSTPTVWVTLTGTNELVGLDVSGSTPTEIARYPTVRQPDTVAVAPGSKTLWVTGRTNGEIQRITR